MVHVFEEYEGWDPTTEPGWVVDELPEPGPLPPSPPDPFDDPVVLAAFEAEMAAEAEMEAAMIPPSARFQAEYGLPAIPQPGSIPGGSSDEAARCAQDLLVQADRVQRHAEAHRMVALLTAYDVSIEDLRIRFGAGIGSRQGVGAKAFFASTGLKLQTSPVRVATLVDTGLTARRDLPATWRVFLAGGTTWARMAIVVQQMDGLDPQHRPDYDRAAADLVIASARLKQDLARMRERLQDDTAAKRARTTHERRAAYLDRGPDGAATLSFTGAAPLPVAIDQGLTRVAVAAHGVDGDRRTVTQLRYDIAMDLLREGLERLADPSSSVPQRRPVDVQLVLTVPVLAWLGRTREQATLQGYGPIVPVARPSRR